MDTVLFFGIFSIYFRVEENFAGGKFREIPCPVDFYFAGGKFGAKSKFANIAEISSTRKIRAIQYSVGDRHKLDHFDKNALSKEICFCLGGPRAGGKFFFLTMFWQQSQYDSRLRFSSRVLVRVMVRIRVRVSDRVMVRASG